MLELARAGRAFLKNPVVEGFARVPWPPAPPPGGRPAVAIVTVNYNTARYISQLVFSLYRSLGRSGFVRLVVVDNGSRDGSVPLLRHLRGAGLLDLIENSRQRYHGPALNQGISHLARTHASGRRVDYVWVLDSDVVVLREDGLRRAVAALRKHGAALAGEFEHATIPQGYAALHSLLMDPRVAWRPEIPPFHEVGAPGKAMQLALRALERPIVHFPFFRERYLLHLGSGTLGAIARARETGNRYYEWAHLWDGFGLHYGGVSDGRETHVRFMKEFRREVPRLEGAALVDACLRREGVGA